MSTTVGLLSAISSSILMIVPVESALFNGYANSKLRRGVTAYCHTINQNKGASIGNLPCRDVWIII